VCRNLDLAYPGYLPGAVPRREAASRRRAPGYRRLRTGPGGPLTSRFAWVLLALALGGLCITAGVLIAVALSGAIGTVDDMIGILLVAAGLWATGWFIALGLRVRAWLRESLDRERPAPLEGSLAPGRGWRVVSGTLLTLLTPLVIIMIAVFGPVIGLISLSGGFHDQALVSTLRQDGVMTTGSIVGDTEFSRTPRATPTRPTRSSWSSRTVPGRWCTRRIPPSMGGRGQCSRRWSRSRTSPRTRTWPRWRDNSMARYGAVP
jgi:hypothetical protein